MSLDRLREAARSLLQDRRFTAVAVTLLAVTIGAITAVYAVVQAVVLRPFPFANQDRLVIVWQRDHRRALPVIEVAHGEMADWRARSHAFEDMAVVGSVNWSLTFAGASEPESVPLSAVSASFFSVLGSPMRLGRGFSPADEQGSLPQVMVISHGLWVRRFGADRHIVGRTVSVKLDADGAPVTMEVVGVMPTDFDFPRGADVWVPAAPLIRKSSVGSYGGPENALRRLRVFYVVGRMKDDVSVDGATRELSHVMRSADMDGGPEAPSDLVVTPMARYLLGPAEPVLWTVLGGAALMLLIACANVAGLQVSRSARRQRALAIRVALGASNGRLVWQTLLESALVTAAALIGAVAVAAITSRGLVLLAPAGVPRLDTVATMNAGVLVFGAAATFLTVALCGLWPALVARRLDAASVLAHGASVAADPGGRRVQRAVVITQVAIALTLLAGSGLFFRTVHGLDRTALGFDPDSLLAIGITPATDDIERWNAYYDALLTRVEGLPNVAAAGAVLLRPLSGPVGWDSQPLYPGQVPENPRTWGLNPHTNLEVVTPGYFRTMGIRLVQGRALAATDTTTAPGAVVISRSTAARLWPGRNPLGQQLVDPTYRVPTGPGIPLRWQTVAGVVEDVRYRGLNDVRLDLYVPSTQSTNRVQQLMIRTRGDAASVVASVRRTARELDPHAGVSDVSVMRDVVAAESAPWRFLMRIFLAFAALAAALAGIGLGAVIAMTVATRQRELAIRAALGADRARLQAVVLREGAWLVAIGVVLGFVGAFALGRGVAHVLVGVMPHDLIALGAAAGTTLAVGALASWLPGRAAGDADPMVALRAE